MPIIKIDNNELVGWYEDANLKVTSPTGKTITLYDKNVKWATPKQKEVYYKFWCGRTKVFVGIVKATIEEMECLLQFSKI